ncbi:hypothetical protein B296_00030827 [Ensete ventricosum]|uniref:Uncharacterized protein n=1 Tax=Ensete ventricosum TaxID=4639 RepID=A0A427A7V7_ENSVE|nr:hypothetical protein B296_00030827 [Ensete ventricosum]
MTAVANRGRRGQLKAREAAAEEGATTVEGVTGGVVVGDRRLETIMLGMGYVEEGVARSDEGGMVVRRWKLQQASAGAAARGLCIVVGGSNDNATICDNVAAEEGAAGWGYRQ